MSLHRHAAYAVLALAVFAYGCSSSSSAPQQTAATSGSSVLDVKPAIDVASARADASQPTVDPRVLPPAREPLAGSPDLNNANFEVSDRTMREMSAAGVPQAQVNSLGPLKGRPYTNVAEFRAAVEDRIGKAAAQQHMGTIMRQALVVKLADAPEAPEGKADLLAAETQKRPDTKRPDAGKKAPPVAATGVTPGSMGSNKFRPVFFDYDVSAVKGDFREAIDHNARVLKAEKALKVVIEGHCDERGSTEYNLTLGSRRAQAVKNALIKAGIEAERMKTVSFGEDRPADPEHTEEAYAKNRRAVINLQ
ncbi:MAG TPA: peptidoglycan-associated lipoprotein Pal [bacterium]